MSIYFLFGWQWQFLANFIVKLPDNSRIGKTEIPLALRGESQVLLYPGVDNLTRPVDLPGYFQILCWRLEAIREVVVEQDHGCRVCRYGGFQNFPGMVILGCFDDKSKIAAGSSLFRLGKEIKKARPFEKAPRRLSTTGISTCEVSLSPYVFG